jgi:ribonuclease P/MRP protein subunit POP1
MEPRNTHSTPASINTPDPWPTTVSYSSLWDPAVRASLKTTKVREGTLNNRRSKLPVPGMPLEYTEADSLIPILLIQRGVFSGQKKSKIVFESQEFTSGWDIILPSIWAKEVWKSLVFAGARVGGLRESRVLSYESGIPAFPYDFPETPAFKSWSDKIEKEDRDAFDKHPLNKRPNFDKLGIAFPFASPFSVLSPSLTLIRGQSVVTLLKNWLFKGDLGSAKDFYQLCVDSNLPNYDVTGSCLVRIRLKVLQRGAPKDRAIIYQASTAEYEYWTNKLKKYSTDVLEDDDAGALGRYPPSSAIVGYVTTGNFSFQNGYGTAIGTVSLQGLIDIFSIARKYVFL